MSVPARLDCARCGRRMHPGYLLERSDTRRVTEWVAGPPEKSIWTGLRTTGRATLPVTTYRCERCGYLESYAHDAATTP